MSGPGDGTTPPRERVESRWDLVDGWRTHARVTVQPVPEGQAPVVLVHGMGVSSRYMVPTAELLAPHHRVYIPDLPGFGESEGPERVPGVSDLADFLAGWTEAVRVGRAAYLGNSFGCQVAAELAVRHPDLVEKLVLQGTTTDPRARTAARLITRWLLDTPKESPSQGPIMLRDYREAGLRWAADVFRRMLEERIKSRET